MTTRVDGINITDGVITEAKLQTKLNPDNAVENNAFNIGVLGFKLAVNDGLTVFNLIDGVVDEFHDNTGVDTAENSNAVYDATSDFYANSTPNQPIPTPQIGRTSITDTGSGTYSVEPTTTSAPHSPGGLRSESDNRSAATIVMPPLDFISFVNFE